VGTAAPIRPSVHYTRSQGNYKRYTCTAGRVMLSRSRKLNQVPGRQGAITENYITECNGQKGIGLSSG